MSGSGTSSGHLSADHVDRAAMNAASLSAGTRAHAKACTECAAGIADARRVVGALRGLAVLVPSEGFTERVMARVRLPLPWHRRVAAAAGQRRAASAAGFVTLSTLAAGAVVWVVRFPDLRPAALASWIAGQAGELLWQATIGLGRVAYGLGLTDLLAAIGADLTLQSAAAGLATIALVCMGSLSVMVRLVREDRPVAIRAQ